MPSACSRHSLRLTDLVQRNAAVDVNQRCQAEWIDLMPFGAVGHKSRHTNARPLDLYAPVKAVRVGRLNLNPRLAIHQVERSVACKKGAPWN